MRVDVRGDECGDGAGDPHQGMEGDTMAFYLLRHDRVTDAVELLSPAVFGDRAEALAALREMVAAGDDRLAGSSDVYAADLDDAQPVLWMGAEALREGADGLSGEPPGPAIGPQVPPEPAPWWESPPIGIPVDAPDVAPLSTAAIRPDTPPRSPVDGSFAWAVADTCAAVATTSKAPSAGAQAPPAAPTAQEGGAAAVRPPDPADAVRADTWTAADPAADATDDVASRHDSEP